MNRGHSVDDRLGAYCPARLTPYFRLTWGGLCQCHGLPLTVMDGVASCQVSTAAEQVARAGGAPLPEVAR